jgi:enoyl-CoA hydratase/carnithine racemase
MAGFGKIGLVPDFGLLHTLPHRVGSGPARQLLLYPEPIDAARAAQIGLVDQMVPAGTALDAALARAASVAQVAPLPLALTRSYLARGLAEALEWERNTQAALFLTADHAEGKAAFKEKRPARFTGV